MNALWLNVDHEILYEQVKMNLTDKKFGVSGNCIHKDTVTLITR